MSSGWYAFAGPVSMARPSIFHVSRPPSSTEAFAKPSDCSIHQKRVAHIGVPMLYSTTWQQLAVGRHAVMAERRLELRDGGHHEMQRGVLIGELALQIEKIGARNMPGLECVTSWNRDVRVVAAFRGGFEIRRAIEQPQVGPIEQTSEFR